MGKSKFDAKAELASLQARMMGDKVQDAGGPSQAENSFRNMISQADLAFLVNQSPVVIFAMTASEGLPLRYVSENIRQFGYSPEEFYSKRFTYAAIIQAGHWGRVQEALDALAEVPAEEGTPLSYCIQAAGGEVRRVSGHFWRSLTSDGGEDGYLGLFLDVTDAEENEERMKLQMEILDKIIAERTAALREVTQRFRNEVNEHRRTGEQLRERTMELAGLNNRMREEALSKRRDESELRQQRDWLAQALGGANFGIWDWHLQEEKIVFDPKGLEIIGIESAQAEMDLDMLKRLLPAEDAARMDAALDRHVAGEIPIFRVQHHVAACGKDERWVEIRGKIVMWDDRNMPLRMAGTIEDITDRHETEDELRKIQEVNESSNKTITELVDNLCYEMRLPIHSIQGFADFGGKKYETASREQLRGYFREIRGHSDKLLQFFDELLDFTRLKSGRLVYSYQPFDLMAMMDRLLERYNSPGKSKFLMHCPDQEGDRGALVCDGEKIKKVFYNLVSNAVEFSPPEEAIEITVTWGEDRVCVSILDRGPGIAAEDQARIFEPVCLFKGDTETFRGKGFGLATCREIVEAHDGAIRAENHPDGGVMFAFEIPLNLDSESRLERVSSLADEIES